MAVSIRFLSLLVFSAAAFSGTPEVRDQPARPFASFQGTQPLINQNTITDNLTLPDDKDWIQLNSGEVLHGAIEELFHETLTFKSKDLGTVKIKLNKIARFYTPRHMAIFILDMGSLEGTLSLDGDVLSVNGGPGFKIDPDEIVSIHEVKSHELERWENKVTLSANFAQGNSDSLEINGKFSGERTTYRSRFRVNYNGLLTETDGETSAKNHRLTSSYDYYRHNKHVFRPIQIDLFHAPLQNIELQSKLSSQIGYEVFDVTKKSWELFIGPSWQWTQFDTVSEGTDETESSIGATISSQFELELNSTIDVSHNYDLTIASERTGGLIHRNVLAFSVELTDIIDLDIDFIWDHTSKPTPDSDNVRPEKNDYRLTFGIGLDL
ncbi:DUF481 domain-containing protein [Thaumasiovibrio subtropicus]|uniref:DUF481 domain-containing protein n=1 Tax=Thaumasiovibrio subtropicus TaxID=1891207 RepID=UPI000B352A61|nr:DUF481 domain-containing protein [Thaumasiovibrio subtropicus]